MSSKKKGTLRGSSINIRLTAPSQSRQGSFSNYNRRNPSTRPKSITASGKRKPKPKPKSKPKQSILWRLFWLIITIYAVKKAYGCNSHESKFMLVPVLALAFFYSPYYLLYYAIFHFVLRVPCKTAVGSMSLNV
jgi:hypothetical protein